MNRLNPEIIVSSMTDRINTGSDSFLWDELRNGSESAFQEIYLRYFQPLNNYGSKFTSDAQLTEDCMQEVFTTIYRNRSKLGPALNIKMYLFKALRRKIIKELRKKMRTIFFPMDFDVPFEPVYFNNETDQTKQILGTVHNLPARQKEVIFLKFYEEMNYDEICLVMNMNYQSVRNLMYRAIQTLRADAEKILLQKK